MRRLKFIVFFFIYTSVVTNSQDFSLNITFLQSEESKYYQSTIEFFYISKDNSVDYALTHNNRKSNDDTDIFKSCIFSGVDKQIIWQTILDKGLNISDSLYQESSINNSVRVSSLINVLIITEDRGYRIKIHGSTDELEEKELYKSSLFLISVLRKMIQECQ